jgi:hypothetical protein
MGATAFAERAGYVRWQQDMANDALARGDLRAARVALRALRYLDFAAWELAQAHLAVLRDMRSEEAELVSAVRKLVTLEAAT